MNSMQPKNNQAYKEFYNIESQKNKMVGNSNKQ